MTLIENALRLASKGLPVFPCLTSKAPACPRGFHDAATDPILVRELFSNPGAALIGVPTGPASGFDVLDVDPRHGGTAWLDQHRDRLPVTRTHATRSGGLHLLFRSAPNVRNTASRIGAGVDVRGGGGYIVWWPAHGCEIIDAAPPAHWPDWLLMLALPPPTPPRTAAAGNRVAVPQPQAERLIRAALDRVSRARDGEKHYMLRNAALLIGGLAEDAGLSDERAIFWLLDALPHGVRDTEAARRTAAWGLAQGRARPIRLPPERTGRDDRHRDLARLAMRLLRRGAAEDDVFRVLHEHNDRSPAPLPPFDVRETLKWAVRCNA